MKKCAFSDIIY